MKVRDLMKKLKKFPPSAQVFVQFKSNGEWGCYDARSAVRSVVTREVNGKTGCTLIRCYDDHIETGGLM